MAISACEGSFAWPFHSNERMRPMSHHFDTPTARDVPRRKIAAAYLDAIDLDAIFASVVMA